MSINGEQYVAVQTGYGGTAITIGPIPPSSAALKYQNVNRIIVFKLGGGAVPMPPARVEEPFPKPPPATDRQSRSIKAGEIKFVEECSRCHVLGPSSTPDLRSSMPVCTLRSRTSCCKGVLAPSGMERFDDI